MHISQPTTDSLVLTSDMFSSWVLNGILMIGSVIFFVFIWVEFDLEFQQDTYWLFVLLFLFLLARLRLFLWPTIISTFDKQSEDLTLEKKWMWKNEIETYQFVKIKDIHTVRKGIFGKARLYYRIEVELMTEKRVRLSNLNYRPQQVVDIWANGVKQFLFQESDASLKSLI